MQIDLIIVGVFLVITLAIGLHASKKVKTFSEYAVGNRKMSDFVITISLIATIYGGRILVSTLDAYYRQGLYMLILDLANPLNLYIASRFMILRMKEFIGHLSVAESMGSLYGPTVRMMTAIFSIITTIALVTSEFKVGLTIASILFPEIEAFSIYSTILLAALVVFYSTFGGAKAVASTDVYQFFLFGICFPILIFIVLYYTKDLSSGWEKLIHMPHFNLHKVLTWNDTLSGVLNYFMVRSIFLFDPARMQRFYMATSVQQARKVFNNSAIIRIILSILFLSVAIALHLGGHNIQPNQNVLDYIVRLSYFPGMRGIIVTAIIALLMSSADSDLHAASVLLTNDIWPKIVGSVRKIGTPSLKAVRIACLLLGITSIIVMSYTTNVLQLITKAVHLYGPTVTVPLIMSSLGFRPRPAAILWTMATSTAISLYRIYYKAQTISQQNVFESIVLSALTLLAIHYLLPKRSNTGWIGIKDYSPFDLQNQETKRWWLRRLQDCKLSFTKEYWKSRFPKKESTFILLGIYLIINTFIALCLMQKEYFSLYIYWYILVIAFGTILIIYPSFDSYKPAGNAILHWVWPVVLFLLLFVFSIQFAKLAHFRPMVFALFISNLALSTVFLSFKIGLVMLGIAMMLHKYIPPDIAFWSACWVTYNKVSIELICAISCLAAALIGFGMYKYLRNKIDTKLKIIALSRHYECKSALEAIYNQVNWSKLQPIYSNKMLQEMGEMLQAPCYYFYTQGQPHLGGELNRFMKQLQTFSTLLLKRVKEERILTLNKKEIEPVSIDLAILQAHNTTLTLGEPVALLVRNQTKVKELIANLLLFERLLTVNLFEISKSKQARDHTVTLTIADTLLRYDYENAMQSGKAPFTLPALAFFISTSSDIQDTQLIYDITGDTSYTRLPKSENQLYQAESRQIVEAHGGYETIIETQKVLTYCYVLPISGQKVMRFKTYDPTVLNSKINETAESLAQEKELLTLLIKETALTKEMVEQTITLIKNAHSLVTRKSGAPYYTHPMAVAKILLEVTKDPTTILAGLLHDLVEDTPIPLTQIELMYGPQVAYIVDMVTHYNTNGYRWKLDDKENKNLLDQCKDIRVVQVKLADRLHNIRTLHFRKRTDQKRIAQDTITFYIPWAKKNNISKWVLEMSHICDDILSKKG